VVVAHKDLFQAFMAFETLDFCARLEIKSRQLGTPIALSDTHIGISKNKQDSLLEEFIPDSHTSEEKRARKEMCSLIQRAYNQNLFTSTQGTFSQRLSEDSFLITPYGVDRKYLDVQDIVRIDQGKREAGKQPSRSAPLHRAIYEMHSHVNSVMIAHPPNIMAFAVTQEGFDSRTIPESYILLRKVPKLPFGSSFMQPRMVADIFQKDTPVAIMENDCIIVTGSSLLNAFDRLEVAEYSAKAIIASRMLGSMVAINDSQVRDIDEAFKL
jgi:L-fuculose-phosphate aldolase